MREKYREKEAEGERVREREEGAGEREREREGVKRQQPWQPLACAQQRPISSGLENPPLCFFISIGN